MNDEKFLKSFALLEAALSECDTEPGHPLRLAALAKAFESTFEYVWKHLKREADQAGFEITDLVIGRGNAGHPQLLPRRPYRAMKSCDT